MSPPVSRVLPCAVQAGFAGSRQLFNLPEGSEDQRKVVHRQVEDELVEILGRLPADLGLTDRHFLCGISQIAIGADTIFTRACARLGIPQCIFLPQPRDVYLAANGPTNSPDFSPEERLTANQLLASDHIIQERVVSDADERVIRLEDCSREILRVSDLIICMFSADAANKPGGTDELFSLAQLRGKKVLEIRVGLTAGKAELVCGWHGPKDFASPALPKSLEPLNLPPGLDAVALPSVAEFCGAVKQHSSAEAQRHNILFSRVVLVVIGTHVLATLCATLALVGHNSAEREGSSPSIMHWIFGMLAVELVALLGGFIIHLWLHHAKSLKTWAISRLLAEIHRSVGALGKLHISVSYLFSLRLPVDLHPLLRTINILHLRSTRPFVGEPWESLRDAYLLNRLTHEDPRIGQIRYYSQRCDLEAKWLRLANTLFLTCSSLAIVSTLAKLIICAVGQGLPALWNQFLANFLGTLAIFLPTLAVGALSWAAAKEYKARVHAFEAMRSFLETQKSNLEQATSARDFHRLVKETESNLLGETAEWYFRTTVIAVP